MDTGGVLQRFDETPISIHRWQGNDVRGFENPDGTLTGGILACGNYPDHTSNGDELRADISSKAAKHSDRVNAGRGRDIQQTL